MQSICAVCDSVRASVTAGSPEALYRLAVDFLLFLFSYLLSPPVRL